MNHSQDLTVGVMFGLAWYYLLAAMLNAAAAAYLSYGEMVSEGASRVGLAPKTRRLPPGYQRVRRLVRLARLDDPGRGMLFPAPSGSPMACAQRPMSCSR